MSHRPPAARGATLTEVLAALVTLTVLAMLAAAGLAETRRASQLDEAINNLKRIARGTESYAADHAGRLWGFTWQPGETHEWIDENGDVVEITLPPDDPLRAGAHQAIYLIRLMDDRVGEDLVPVPGNWIAQVLYSHLPLVAYLDAHPLDRWTADPGDRVRLNWKDDPTEKFDLGFWLPLQPDPANANAFRWPYSSSYLAVPAAWDANQSDLKNGTGFRVAQGNTHNSYSTPVGAEIFPQNLADVAYPAQKAHVHDKHQRHFGPRRPFYGIEEARIPVAHFDGSVRVRHTDASNPGWAPNLPSHPCDPYLYAPTAWEPDPVTDQPNGDLAKGFYHWTRAGLKGVDFGGLPLDTGQAEPGECPF